MWIDEHLRRYVVVLWLSAILLTPFDLASMDTQRDLAKSELPILSRLLNIGAKYLQEATRLRDAAAFMLAKPSPAPPRR